MKTIAIILLLVYQIGCLLTQINLKEEYDKELRNKVAFIGQLIPIAMCIILAM